MSVLYFFSLLLLANVVLGTKPNHYWREYTGIIPEDAVVGGKDINDQDVYIGQAYIHGEGLIVTQITAGASEVAVPIKGVKKVKRDIKILCGPLQNFGWIRTNSTDFHLAMVDKNPVLGGHEDGHGSIHVGRIYHEGGTRIGKINSFNVGNVKFRFADSYDREPMVASYEVLVNL